MILNQNSAEKIAESLLQIKAIKLNPTTPFQWASGWKSPIYCDNRKTLSYPPVRTFIRQQFVEAINERYPNVEVIAGVATGGIALGALVAEAMGLPCVYVRSASNGQRMQHMIEGDIANNQKVVVIEDLISTGGSSLKAVAALREEGCDILGMVAIFTYGFELAENNFKESKCDLVTLSDYDSMLKAAVKANYVSENALESLAQWRVNPAKWDVVIA